MRSFSFRTGLGFLVCRLYPNLVSSFLAALWFQYVVFGFGVSTDGDLFKGAPATVESLLGLWIIAFAASGLRRGRWLLVPVVFALGICTPLRRMQGGLTEAGLLTLQNLETLWGTDASEALDFTLSTWGAVLSSWDAESLTTLGIALLPMSAVIALIGRCRRWEEVIPQEAGSARAQGAATVAATTLLVMAALPSAFASSPVPLSEFLFGIERRSTLQGGSSADVNVKEGEGGGVAAVSGTWSVTGEIPNRKRVRNYVLVIGEALRADALQLNPFGNPFPTTPFLSSIPTRTCRLVSPSYATAQAVPRMLALTRDDAALTYDVRLNVVRLAKDAGFRTYWLSTQPKGGRANFGVRLIAESADETEFSATRDDFSLVTSLEERLQKDNGPQPRLFVLHTYGSHESFCNRTGGVTMLRTGYGQTLDCYLTSVRKTDRLLERIARSFQRRNETYSIVYVSDHGVNLVPARVPVRVPVRGQEQEGAATYAFRSDRNPKSKSTYEVPLVMLGSDVAGDMDNTSVTYSKTTAAEAYARYQAGVYVTSGTGDAPADEGVSVSDGETAGDPVFSSMRFTSFFPTWIGVTTNRTEPSWTYWRDRDDASASEEPQPSVLFPNGKRELFANLQNGFSLRALQTQRVLRPGKAEGRGMNHGE